MPITLVRHAEVETAYIGKYNGHIDIGLSERGKAQAQALAEKLQAQTYDEVYCSDLRRARDTLAAFSLDVEPIFTKALREKSWGRHEGKSFEEIEAEGIKYENFTQWIEALDGERMEVFQSRVFNFLHSIEQRDKNILVVTHAGVIKVLQSVHNRMSLENTFYTSIGYAEFCVL